MGKFSTINLIAMLTTFIVSVLLVCIGQSNVGYTGLTIEVVGLCGLCGLLFYYNSKYR